MIPPPPSLISTLTHRQIFYQFVCFHVENVLIVISSFCHKSNFMLMLFLSTVFASLHDFYEKKPLLSLSPPLTDDWEEEGRLVEERQPPHHLHASRETSVWLQTAVVNRFISNQHRIFHDLPVRWFIIIGQVLRKRIFYLTWFPHLLPQDLVFLHAHSYWSSPAVSRDLNEDLQHSSSHYRDWC